MAKGSAMGLWKGKKGSSVFFKIANSNSLQKQGIRERNYEPANPQSYNQAGQRMRMYPAQAVYGAIKDVIERSWQGVKYGQMSRQEYLKRALRQSIVPAVSKGMGVVVPAPYQIAKGTLQEFVAESKGYGNFTIPVFCTTGLNWDSTVAAYSESVLDMNPALREGDQITVVCCHTNVDGNGFYWGTASVILNTADTVTTMGEVWSRIATSGDELITNQTGIRLESDNYIYMAAACVISRDGATPLRSSATLACDFRAGNMPLYYNDTAFAEARKSYQKQESVRLTDWPADPDGEGSSDGGSSTSVTYSVTAYPEVGGTVKGGGTYERGSLVSLSATPATNYGFTGWYPSAADAAAGTNLISNAAIITLTAGDSSAYGGVRSFCASFTFEEQP